MIHPPSYFERLIDLGILTSPDIDSVLGSPERTDRFLLAVAMLGDITQAEWELLHLVSWELRRQVAEQENNNLEILR